MELSNEDFEEGKCGLLKKATYGTHDAATNWELQYTEMVTEAGFRQGSHSTYVFYHEHKNVLFVVHGDDFTVFGPNKSLGSHRGVAQHRSRANWREVNQAH